MEQICFTLDDKYLLCNGVYCNGVFIPAKNKWFKIPINKRKTV